MNIEGTHIITVGELKEMLAKHNDSDPIMIDTGRGRAAINKIVRRDPGNSCQPTLVIESNGAK